MRSLPTVVVSMAVAVAACGGQNTGPTHAGSDASVVDVATDTSAAETSMTDAAGDDVSSPDAALCGGCAPGLLCCNVLMGGTYQCIDPKTDPLDCGGCNIECGVNKYCGNGTCAVPPCSSTCTSGLCCGAGCCAHGRICCQTHGGLQCVGGITCP